MFRCLALLTCALITCSLVADAGLGQSAGKDQHGDPLPAGALARLGSARWRQGGTVTYAAFLPDGKSVVTVGEDWTIRIWDYPSGKELRRIGRETPSDTDARNFRAAALSPDGKTIAASFDNKVLHLRDVATGKELPRLVANQAGIAAVAFSPDSKELVTLDLDGVIRVWDYTKGEEIRQLGVGTTTPSNNPVLLYSPDGKWLAEFTKKAGKGGKGAGGNFNKGGKGNAGAAGSSGVRFWNPTTGAEIFSMTAGKKVNLRAAAASPNGKLFAFSSGDGTVILLDADNGIELHALAAGKQNAEALLFSRDGSKIYARSSQEQRVREWDVATGQLLRTFGDGPLLNPTTNTTNPSQTRMTLSPDGATLVVSGHDKTPVFFDLATGKERILVSGSSAPLAGLQFMADGKHLFTKDSDNVMRQWDITTAKDLGPWRVPPQDMRAPLSADGKYVASAAMIDGSFIISLADATNGKTFSKSLVFPARGTSVRMHFSPTGKMLAARVDANTLELYDVPGGKLLRVLDLALAGGNNSFLTKTLTEHGVFSADGSRLAVPIASDALGVWDTATGQLISNVTLANDSAGQGTAFSADGRCLAVDLNDGSVALYELATGRVRRTFGQAQVPLARTDPLAGQRIAFSPDGKALAVGSFDRVVQVWDVTTGRQLAAFKGHTGPLTAVAFAPGGKVLASASTDTTALLWDVSKLAHPVPPRRQLQPGDLDKLWQILAESDASLGFAAIFELSVAANEAIELIKKNVKPTPASNGPEHLRLITDLDDAQYDVRQAATQGLFKLGEPALPAIHKALTTNPPPETRRRLEMLRTLLTSQQLKGDRLREYRAVEVLERIGTPEARQVLQTLASGAPGAMLTTSAQAALKR